MADNGVGIASLISGDIAMKTIFSALIALSVLAGIAAPASALDADKFWKEHATSGER